MPSFYVASHYPFFELCPCLKALLNIKMNQMIKLNGRSSQKRKNPPTRNKTSLEVELHRVRTSNKMMRMRTLMYKVPSTYTRKFY
jgi:hypothetical protein